MTQNIGTDRVLLELEHVDMRFGGVHAVRDMSFCIMDNALTGIIGPNGAGKTTVFNIISGVYNPTAGSIWFRDQDITPTADKQTLLTARSNVESWTTHHRSLLQAQDTGDYSAAVAHISGNTSSFDALDQDLAALMGKARTSLRSYINEGLSATRLVATPVLLLSLFSVFAVWIGIRPRFQEYL